MAVATANGVKVETARRWIRMYSDGQAEKKRGGKTKEKVLEMHVARMIRLVEENPQITLQKIKCILQQEFDLHIHTSTINRHLTGNLFTVKKLRVIPSSANSDDNKQKRATCMRNIMEL